MADTLASFERKIGALVGNLDDEAMKRIAVKLGVAAKGDAARAVDADLGGTGFSGWPKAPMNTAFEATSKPGEITFGAQRRSTGPWTVAEVGRHPGMSGPVQGPALKGFTKTGRMRGGKVKKWNGSTQGKGTWSDAVGLIDAETPGRVQSEVEKALRDALRG